MASALTIIDVPQKVALITFKDLIEEYKALLESDALTWFHLAYKSNPLSTDESRDLHEKKCCDAAKCLIAKFKAIKVTNSVMPI